MHSLWKQFENDVDQILEAMAKGETDQRLQAMTSVIVGITQTAAAAADN